MRTVFHKDFAISVDHPALWVDKGVQIVRDLVEVLTHREITLACLRHLLASRKRLVTGAYGLPDGRGCLMYVLTEPLGAAQVRSREDLVALFGREQGRRGCPGYVAAQDSAEYQPAKWLVRLIDGHYCEDVRARYGRACELFDYDLVLAVAGQIEAQATDDSITSSATSCQFDTSDHELAAC